MRHLKRCQRVVAGSWWERGGAHSRWWCGLRVTRHEFSGSVAVSRKLETLRAMTGLSMRRPTSVLMLAERGSRLKLPTKALRSSMTSALVWMPVRADWRPGAWSARATAASGRSS